MSLIPIVYKGFIELEGFQCFEEAVCFPIEDVHHFLDKLFDGHAPIGLQCKNETVSHRFHVDSIVVADIHTCSAQIAGIQIFGY